MRSPAARPWGGCCLTRKRPPALLMPEGGPASDVPWLEPYVDSYVQEIADDARGPGARYASRETVQLAFVAVIQQLPPRRCGATLMACGVPPMRTCRARFRVHHSKRPKSYAKELMQG